MNDDITINLDSPKNKSILVINNNFYVHFIASKPNLWWRIWYYLLLGWKWKDVKYDYTEKQYLNN